MSCQRKYFLQKIAKADVDSDADVDTKHFRLGKAFHQLLEDVFHDTSLIDGNSIRGVCDTYTLNFDVDGPHLLALLRHFKVVQKKHGLIATHCELEILTPNFRGFVDVIHKDPNSEDWWISDIKTSSSYFGMLHSKLETDWQLNLYAHHAPYIAEKTGYKLENFKGCRYLLNVKSKLKKATGESFLTYADRLRYSTSSHDIWISKEDLDTNRAYEVFSGAYAEIAHLHAMNGSNQILALKNAQPNFNSCTNYFKACEYWSSCHKKTFSEGRKKNVNSST